ASDHEKRGLLLRSEGQVAVVHKDDLAPRVNRIGIENLLILFATRAADRQFAGPDSDPDRLSTDHGAGRTRGTSGTRRISLTLCWLLALPARSQEKGGG